MSLINQVLNDLEQRRADGASARLPRDVRPLPARQDRRQPLVVAGLAVAITVPAALWAWQAFGPGRPLPVTPPLPAQAALSTALPPLSLPPSPPIPVAPAADSGMAPLSEPGPVSGSSTDLRLSPNLSLPAATRQPQPALPPGPKVGASADPARRNVPPAPPAPPAATAWPSEHAGLIDVQAVTATPQEKAERLYRSALAQFNQGRSDDGLTTLRAALREDPAHVPARQMLVKIYLDTRSWDAAQGVLADGLALLPRQLDWAMLLARLHAERGDNAGALGVLEKHEAAGRSSAAYQGAAGAILQRLGRQGDALGRFGEAARLEPGNGRWPLGLATAHEALGQAAEAREAYQRAFSARTLPPDLQAFVEAKLK